MRTIIIIGMTSVFGINLWSHCQIPCGIYDDQMRVDMIKEHILTIEKSINEINSLSKKGMKNYNQIIRWVMNKEKHADEIGKIITYYFLSQRIKPSEKDNTYLKKLGSLHRMMVLVMKSKQNSDLKYTRGLMRELTIFSELYFKKHKH